MRKIGTTNAAPKTVGTVTRITPPVMTAFFSRLLSLFAALAFLPTQATAQVAFTPDAGYTTCRAYTYTGADQGFTVPANIASIKVKAWGAGAGGSLLASAN